MTFYEFVKDIDMIMKNDIMEISPDYWQPIYHPQDEESGEYGDIFQWFIINENDAEYLERQAEKNKYKSYAIYYNPRIQMWVLGVTHFGTAWYIVEMY